MTIASMGAMVTVAQVLLLLFYLLSIIFTFGLALFVFVIPLFVFGMFAWASGDALLPAPAKGRKWIAVLVSAPVSVLTMVLGVALALRLVDEDAHNLALAYLAHLVIITVFAAVVGAAFWSLVGVIVRWLSPGSAGGAARHGHVGRVDSQGAGSRSDPAP